jgi:hypothetical protein
VTTRASCFAHAAGLGRLREAFRAHRPEKLCAPSCWGISKARARELGLVVARHRPAKVRSWIRVTMRADAVLASAACAGAPSVLRRRDADRWRDRPPHQIRASFAHLGHPVAGDRVYGPTEADDPTAAPRQMLHAARLRLDEIAAESPDPDDLVAVLARLRAAS